jgi:hypothetical protein
MQFSFKNILFPVEYSRDLFANTTSFRTFLTGWINETVISLQRLSFFIRPMMYVRRSPTNTGNTVLRTKSIVAYLVNKFKK